MKKVPDIPAKESGRFKKEIIRSLHAQGFQVQKGKILPPVDLSKEELRRLHAAAVAHRIDRAKPGLVRKEPKLLQYIASGCEIAPKKISPRLIEVTPGSKEELLFRYASLHWSIPVSSGYGRRLRFLVIDEHNNKLIGIIGLGDPVFSLKPRDEWVGWSMADRKQRLKYVMDAFVLGAVPPYSLLLCGKLVAMLVASDTVRKAFKKKYGGVHSVIQGCRHDGRLALITTTSALGRSSIYNRLKYKDQLIYHRAGFTKGSGDFHFSDGLYEKISEFAEKYCKPTAKQELWGKGFRNRREVIRKTLASLGLSSDLVYHGIKREVFVVPLAKNASAFLRGEHQTLRSYQWSVDELFGWFRERWLLPRARRDERYRSFNPECYRLWDTR